VIYGSKTRDYLYVSDLIDALMLVALKRDTFNVGTGKETSLESLYLDIAYLLNKRPNPIFERERPGEIKNQNLNCDKLRKLGWKPKINLIQGLELCLK
jgi:UDP-glucose 4-epimerase